MPGWWSEGAGGVGEAGGGDGEALAYLDGRGVVVDAEEDEASGVCVGLCSWRGEPVDDRELVGGPDGEDDEEDEAGEIDGAAAAEAGDAADVNHRDVGEPHGKGEQNLGVAEVGGADGAAGR